jgi:hypothetical protein
MKWGDGATEGAGDCAEDGDVLSKIMGSEESSHDCTGSCTGHGGEEGSG